MPPSSAPTGWHTTLITGQAYPPPWAWARTASYQTTVDYDRQELRDQPSDPMAPREPVSPLNGLPANNALVVAPSGEVYVTTYTYESDRRLPDPCRRHHADGGVRT